MHQRPRVLINIFLLNSTENKILFLKKHTNSFWELIGEKLSYGEEFEDCAKRVLFEETTLLIEDTTRIKFVCSYNAIDKVKKKHFISVNYYLHLTQKEEKQNIHIDNFKYQTCRWFTYEEILKMKDTIFFGVNTFFDKYKLENLGDIKNIHSN